MTPLEREYLYLYQRALKWGDDNGAAALKQLAWDRYKIDVLQLAELAAD